ncbi:hypothetical protein [uncultured Brevundimonas sp.]|uniref:hypothetical protein n=1 Tax=uncultured Brevundimonas sp. TaxID=213418 RepID=UPI0030EC1504|tara:strand:+ start:781 stop:966 length:186 start_codon:yes stop_codon:yes gene_type:complete
MFTVAQCLAKAVELEQRAAGEDLPQEVRADYLILALQWRRLAFRAQLQDLRTAAIAGTLQA